jgi:hypothetical protein
MISGRTIGQDGKSLESPTPTLFRTLMDVIPLDRDIRSQTLHLLPLQLQWWQPDWIAWPVPPCICVK